MANTPDPPSPPPSAVVEKKERGIMEALDLLPVDGTKRTLSQDHPTLPRPRSLSDGRQCSRRQRGRSLSPFPKQDSTSLSSASSSESLSGPSSRGMSQQHQSHTRNGLHDRRTPTRTQSDNGRSHSPRRLRRDRQRRRWYDSKRKYGTSIPDKTERVTLESRLAAIRQLVPQHSTSTKERSRRYYQNYDAKFFKTLNSWKKSTSKPPPLPKKAALMRQVSTPTSSQAPNFPQLSHGTMSREYRSFQYNSSMLCDDVMGSQIDPKWLAEEMWSKGLITHQVRQEVTHSRGSLLKDKQLLLDALRSQISTNPAHFYEFLEILRKQGPALQECCSKLESFPDEDVTPVPDPLSGYAECLRTVYKQGVFYPKWPRTEMKKYIKLITIERKSHHSISMHKIFQSDSNDTVNRVLVEGGPGSGKSTFALELCTRWGKGEMFHQFALVILLPLRDKRVKKAKSLIDLFSAYPYKGDLEAVVRTISYNYGERVLLILEGFDEFPITEETQDTKDFLLRLFANTELPNATVLVTTRPHASILLHEYCDTKARVLQIVGFGEEEVKRYIQAAGLSVEQQSSLTEYLDINPHIREMVYNPLNCAILVQLYKADGRRTLPPKTSTHLFNQLVKDLLLRYMQDKYGKCPTINWENFPQYLPQSECSKYHQLCEMAFKGFENGESEFDLPENFTHLNFMVDSLGLYEATVTFRFLHPSLQEYLTAFWIHTHYSPEEQLKLMKEHINNPGHYDNVLRFLAGLSKTINWKELAKHVFVGRQELNVASFYLSNDIQGVQLPFLSWLFENQSIYTCAKVLGEGTVGFYSTYHTTPFDYYVLAHCIANSVCKWEIQVQLPTVDWLDTFSKGFQVAKGHSGAIVALDVGHSQISKEGWEFLFSDSISPLQSLQQLIFHNTTPPRMGLQKLLDHLPKLKYLQCLALGHTPLGEGGAVDLMKALPQTRITELHLYNTGIGFSDCQTLASYLSDPQCKLKSVDISSNSLQEESVNVFTCALVHNVSLTKLSMSASTFSPQSFTALISRLEGIPERTPLTVLDLQLCVLPQGSVGQLCMKIAADEKCALQSLALGYNPLELSDVEALATMLETNNSLIFLYLKDCSISAAGFSALSSSLYKNTMLCELSLSGNEISQESVNAVCQGFFSEARFACENILKMPTSPLLCLDSCPDDWKNSIIKQASDYLLTYCFSREAQAKHRNQEVLPNVKEFMEFTSNVERQKDVCSHHIHFGEHDPSCGRDRIEEMRPSYRP